MAQRARATHRQLNVIGKSSYIYIAFASSILGADFTLINNPTLEYTAILSSAEELLPPVVENFTGLWFKRSSSRDVHNPVTIHPQSSNLASINSEQVLVISPRSLPVPETVSSISTNYMSGSAHSHELGVVDVSNIVTGKKVKYGALYNWFIVTDPRGITSNGDWIVPTTESFNILITLLSGSLAGGKLKEEGLVYWNDPNTGGTNEFGFNAKGSGVRAGTTGNFYSVKEIFSMYTSDPAELFGPGKAFRIFNNSEALTSVYGQPESGCSLRLVKNYTTLTPGHMSTYVGNDGKKYKTICIGTQEWLAEDLNETKYRNGDWIYGMDAEGYIPISNNEWISLFTGAMCYYEDDVSNGMVDIPLAESVHLAVTIDPSSSTLASINEYQILTINEQEGIPITSGLGMDFLEREIILGVPSSITDQTENSLTETSHTHALGDITVLKVVSGYEEVVIKYGYLYNWYTIVDPKQIANKDWRVPTDADYTILTNFLGGEVISGGQLKSQGTTDWANPNNTTISVGFNGAPGGIRTSTGVFTQQHSHNVLWTSTPRESASTSWYRTMRHDLFVMSRFSGNKKDGYSVRLVKEDNIFVPKYTGNDGKTYNCVQIGSQVWMAEHLMETLYKDLSAIPEVMDTIEWGELITGGRCSYANDETNAGTGVPVITTNVKLGDTVNFQTHNPLVTIDNDSLRRAFITKEQVLTIYEVKAVDVVNKPLDNITAVNVQDAINELSWQTAYDYNIIGDRDGVNTLFTLPYNYIQGTPRIYLNGLRLQKGIGWDYIESPPNGITLNYYVYSVDLLLIDYIKLN